MLPSPNALMIDAFANFLKTIALSVNPFSYHDFAERSFRDVFLYFIGVLLMGFVLTNILLLPFYLGLPALISDSLSHITKFETNTDIEMSAPIEIPKQDAAFVMDTTGSIESMRDERVIVTKDYIYYRAFLQNKRIDIDRLLDVVGYRSDATWSMISLLLFLAPSFVFFVLLGLFLKQFLLIFLTSFIVFFIIRVLFLFEISFKNALASTFYAGTLMILLEAVIFPINPSWLFPLFDLMGLHFYLVSYLVFFVFSLLGLLFLEKNIKLGSKKDKSKKSKGD